MNDDSRTMKVGAIASYLDHCGVSGDLHEKSVKLIDILDGLESVDTSTNDTNDAIALLRKAMNSICYNNEEIELWQEIRDFLAGVAQRHH